MIIKSKGHKYMGAFKKLVYYILNQEKTEKQEFLLTRYVVGDKTPENVIAHFEQNEKKRIVPRRKNSNVIYHDIISFEQRDSDKLKDIKLLKKLVRKYASLRADNAVMCSTYHLDKQHFHIHLLFSATGIDSKNVRLSREDFKKSKIEIEAWQDQFLKLEYSKIDHGSKKKSTDMIASTI